MNTRSFRIAVFLVFCLCSNDVVEGADNNKLKQYRKDLIESSQEVHWENLRLNMMDQKPTKKWSAGRVAFIELVKLGEPGWKVLIDLCLDLSWMGDAARSMNTLVYINGKTAEEDRAISKQLNGFQKLMDRECAIKAKNETWAILYAHAERRFLIDDQNAMHSTATLCFRERLGLCCQDFKHVDDALVPLSHLRVYFSGVTKFPGHRHPWSGDEDVQKASLLKIKTWCINFRKSLPEPMIRPN